MGPFKAIQSWWERWWLWVGAVSVLVTVGFLLGLWWRFGQRPPGEVEPYVAFFDSLIGAIGVLVAGTIMLATVHSAARTATMVRLAAERDAAERRIERRTVVNAFVGSALDTALFAGLLAELQRLGLRWRSRWLPDTKAQVEFMVATYTQMVTSAAAVTRARERLRYEVPELEAVFIPVADLISEAVQAASQGKSQRLVSLVEELRQRVDDIREMTEESVNS